jgi:hypothetical protein
MARASHNPHLLRRTMFVLAGAVLLAVAATFLPDDPYQRFQLLDGTLYAKARWSYERIHFDPRPIDVAIVGDSRTDIGLDSRVIERRMAADGKPANVANMSLMGDGRNAQWVFVQELLKAKHPKVIVVSVNDHPHPWGHDSFRYIASTSDIWAEALHGLHDTKKNLVFLPFRQLHLFAARLLPRTFHLTRQFDPAAYNPGQDSYPIRHRNDAGEMIDMSETTPRAVLLQQLKDNAGEFGKRSKLPSAVRAITDADDKVFTKLIAQAAAAHGVKLLFVYQPAFDRPAPIERRAFYSSFGRIEDNVDLSSQDRLYHDWSHFNTEGTRVASDRVADALAAILGGSAAPDVTLSNAFKNSSGPASNKTDG